MRVAGVGAIEFLFCCIPFWIVFGAILWFALLRNRPTTPTYMPPGQEPLATQQTTPAGWYADPLGNHQLRYWDGWQWTQHVADHGVQKVDPL